MALQNSSCQARVLSETERAKLEADTALVSDFKQNKLELEAKKNWDLFYKRNTTKFFKDRHWTKREFQELTASSKDGSKKTFFEVGCGVGNFLFPLLEEEPNIFMYACDFSQRAVDFVKSNSQYDPERCLAFQCDITQDDIIKTVPAASVDVATLIFVLSAIHPDKMVQAISNIAATLKDGGLLLVRDYGLYDHAMLRFAKGHKLSENFYVRQDGTRAYYFSTEKLNSLMEEAGLQLVSNIYIERATVNKKEGIDVPRIFVQGKFLKSSNKSVTISPAGDVSSGSQTVGVSAVATSINSGGENSNCVDYDSKQSEVLGTCNKNVGNSQDIKDLCSNLSENVNVKDGNCANSSSDFS